MGTQDTITDNSSGKGGGYSPKKCLAIITVVATFGGLLFGYDTGVVNGALPFMAQKDQLNLTPFIEGLIVSSLLLGAAFGSIIGGRMADRRGRRKTILFLAVLFLVSTIGCTLSPTAAIMICFRFLLGLAVGGASVTVPSYLAEMAPPERRGRMIIQNDLMVVTGQFLAFLFNAILGVGLGETGHVWRYMLALAGIPAIVLWFGMKRMPESPRWLMAKGKADEALQVLRMVREDEVAAIEIKEIEGNIKKEAHMEKATFKDLATPWIRRIVFLGIGLSVAQQITGINAIMYYGTQILMNSGFGTDAALIGNVGNGIISVLATWAGIWLVTAIGRRPLLIAGQTGIIASLAAIAFFATTMAGSANLSYIVLALTICFLICQQASVSSVTWLMIAEIFPQRIRGLGIGISVFCMWVANFFIGLSFPVLLSGVGLGMTFYSLAAINIISVIMVYLFVPETRGLSLEVIEDRFRSHKADPGKSLSL